MAIFSPGGATLKMSGYAPAFKKSVEKGPFSTIRRRRRLFKKRGTFQWSSHFRGSRTANLFDV